MSVNGVFNEGLPHRVTIYVPSTINVDAALDSETAERLVEDTLRFLSSLFGGATAPQSRGAWVSNTGVLVIESVTQVYANSRQLSHEVLVQIKTYVVELRERLGQEAIAVELDGTLFFV